MSLLQKEMQTVGIEPTLLRTCALSMRLNHSAKTAPQESPPKHDTTQKKQPAGGIEPPIYRLRSGCLATWPYRLMMEVLGLQTWPGNLVTFSFRLFLTRL